MKTNASHSRLISCLILICLALSGCSGPDELRLCNHYPFTVTLWADRNIKIGSVASNEEHLFIAGSPYLGDGMEGLYLTDSAGKSLGNLKSSGALVRREHVSRANGATTWRVDVGPPGSAPKEVGNIWDPLIGLWEVTPFIILLGIFVLSPFLLAYLFMYVREKFSRDSQAG